MFRSSLSFRACVVAAAGFLSGPAVAGLEDPFATEANVPARPGDSFRSGLKATCALPADKRPLDLVAVVDQALCNNPQTRLAWANARGQAAQLGVVQGAYLPGVAADAARSRNGGDGGRYYQTTASLSASYLLYDFGGRAATLETARELLAALVASQDAALQSVFLAAVQAYYQLFAAEAAVAAARESERASAESFRAAEARLRIGVGTPADRLQAQTALSQARLARIQAEGNAQAALGTLANVMGLDAGQAPALAPPPPATPEAGFERDVTQLIEAAKRARPDLAAAEAQVRAAQANVEAARAAGMPSLFLTAADRYSHIGSADSARGNSIGLALSIPLFTGFQTTYRIRSAQAQAEARAAQRDQTARQVSLDVWQGYYALLTNTQAVRSSMDLLASAVASEKVARGRYEAGVGSIIELLNAQSALAAARQQEIQASYAWRVSKAALAQAMGELDFSTIEKQ